MQWFSFKGIETNLAEAIWFVYTGKAHGARVTIELSGGHGHVMGRLVISPGGDVSVSCFWSGRA